MALLNTMISCSSNAHMQQHWYVPHAGSMDGGDGVDGMCLHLLYFTHCLLLHILSRKNIIMVGYMPQHSTTFVTYGRAVVHNISVWCCQPTLATTATAAYYDQHYCTEHIVTSRSCCTAALIDVEGDVPHATEHVLLQALSLTNHSHVLLAALALQNRTQNTRDQDINNKLAALARA